MRLLRLERSARWLPVAPGYVYGNARHLSADGEYQGGVERIEEQMNLLYGFLIGIACLAIPMIWQYRAYRSSIRAVSDKWKGINDEWALRYHNLYDSWMSGVQPTAKQRMGWDMEQMNKKMNEYYYQSAERSLQNQSVLMKKMRSGQPIQTRGAFEPGEAQPPYEGLAELIDSATVRQSKPCPNCHQGLLNSYGFCSACRNVVPEVDNTATKGALTQEQLEDVNHRLRNWRENVSPGRTNSATKDKSNG